MLMLIKTFISTKCGIVGGYCLTLSYLSFAALALIFCVLANFFTKRYLVNFVRQVILKARPTLASTLNQERITSKVSRIAPAFFLYLILHLEKSVIMADFPQFFSTALNLTIIYLLIMFILASNSILNALENYYNTYEVSKRRPIKSYLQIVKILLVFIVAVLYFFKEPGTLLTSLAAYSALLVLLFRDSIAGFLASIQVSSYDMIRIGDWIDMPKFGASGDVEEISLTTVKVRNFDKTVTTIPSYALINDGVKNWRGMKESGGRRIKRAMRLDLNSAKFCTLEILEAASKLKLLSSIIAKEKEKIEQNKFEELMTNTQLFRSYLELYLENHKDIYNDGFTSLVRELEPDAQGLPVEVYSFTKTTNWKAYERIQASIFDHLFAVLPFFHLKPFQMMTGNISTKEL